MEANIPNPIKNSENLLFNDIDKKLKEKLLNLKTRVRKVLLIQPIQIEEEKIDIRIALNKRYYMYPPYGLGILNTIVKNSNYESDILDLNFETFKIIHKEKNINSKQLSSGWKKILIQMLKDYKPDMVGVSCTFTMNHKNMMDVFHEVKKYDKEIITVAGGVHVSNATEIVLKEGTNIDFASTYV